MKLIHHYMLITVLLMTALFERSYGVKKGKKELLKKMRMEMRKQRDKFFAVTEFSDILSTTTATTQSVFQSDVTFLRALYTYVEESFNYTIHEARYKWRHGIEIPIKKERYNDLLKSAEKIGGLDKYVQKDINSRDIVQFMMDTIDASSLIEYVLTSNWYANVISVDGISPDGPEMSLSEIHANIDRVQADIIERFARVYSLRLEAYCGDEVGKAAFDKTLPLQGTLFRIALQTSMVNFCKTFITHRSPSDPITTIRLKLKKLYRRKPRVYTSKSEFNGTRTPIRTTKAIEYGFKNDSSGYEDEDYANL